MFPTTSHKNVRDYFLAKDTDCDKYACPLFIKSNTLIKPGFNKIIVIIDVSGSTDNAGGSFGTRFAALTQSKTKTKTKIIIMAELEGVANHLVQMMGVYDLTGIQFIVYAFSTLTIKCHSSKIISNENMYDDVLTNLDTHVEYQCGGTDLNMAVKTAFAEVAFTDRIELIIATDGQTENADSTFNELTMKGNFNLFVIGAGSISDSLESDSSNRRGMYLNQVQSTRNGLTVKNETPIIMSASSSECNLLYLQQLAQTAPFKGTYCGAYGDYVDMIEASKEYLIVSRIEFKVVLGGGSHDSPVLGVLDRRIQQPLLEKKSCLIKTSYGYYIMISSDGVNGIQMAVEPVFENDVSLDFLVGEMIHTLKVKDFEYETCFNHQITYDYELSIGNIKCKLCLSTDKYIRVRPLVSIKSEW